jgi:hypothetical protein
VNYLRRILDLLPPPYTQTEDSVLAGIIDLAALELEIVQEDLDHMRQTHWIETVYDMRDATKLGALFNIAPFPWENLRLYRDRLLALVTARLRGALAPDDIRRFALDYLQRGERDLDCIFVPPGLKNLTISDAFKEKLTAEQLQARPSFRGFELVEYPKRTRTSQTLADRNGRVPYLLRWSEANKGLDHTVVEFHVTGLVQNRTVVPTLLNLTTGDLIGFAGRVPFGQTLSVLRADPDAALDDRKLRATLDGRDVADRMFSVGNVQLGVPFGKQQQDPAPQLPRLPRGANDWIFLAVGLYDIRGLDRFFFALAGKDLHEAVFDETAFDASLFPSGTIARLDMAWTESEPASFELRVPAHLVIEPASADVSAGPPHRQVTDALVASVAYLRAAGVKAHVVFVPFEESQPQTAIARVPWMVLDPETGPAGDTGSIELGGRFGDSALDRARFE